MTNGSPTKREYLFVLNNGTMVLDWGDGKAQDLMLGDFIQYEERDYSHAIQDHELDLLVRAGRVSSFDARNVNINSLPEPPRKMID